MSGLQSMPTVRPQVHRRSGYVRNRQGVVPAAPEVLTPGAVRVCPKVAAQFLGITENALSHLRRKGRGPAWYFHMGRIAYDVAVLKAYVAGEENAQ